MINKPSPNHDERNCPVDMIVLHYTGMLSAALAIDRLTDENAKVSAHYIIDEDGQAYQLVAEDRRAWHAGVSTWRGAANINARSVGIEIVNPGHEWGYRAFPPSQMETVQELVAAIVGRHHVRKTNIVGHSDVAPERKEDPGELFPWAQLADAGLAIGPYRGAADPQIPYDRALTALGAIGYGFASGKPAAAVLAFQRRFCPGALGQGVNPLTKAALLWAEAAFDAAAL